MLALFTPNSKNIPEDWYMQATNIAIRRRATYDGPDGIPMPWDAGYEITAVGTLIIGGSVCGHGIGSAELRMALMPHGIEMYCVEFDALTESQIMDMDKQDDREIISMETLIAEFNRLGYTVVDCDPIEFDPSRVWGCIIEDLNDGVAKDPKLLKSIQELLDYMKGHPEWEPEGELGPHAVYMLLDAFVQTYNKKS